MSRINKLWGLLLLLGLFSCRSTLPLTDDLQARINTTRVEYADKDLKGGLEELAKLAGDLHGSVEKARKESVIYFKKEFRKFLGSLPENEENLSFTQKDSLQERLECLKSGQIITLEQHEKIKMLLSNLGLKGGGNSGGSSGKSSGNDKWRTKIQKILAIETGRDSSSTASCQDPKGHKQLHRASQLTQLMRDKAEHLMFAPDLRLGLLSLKENNDSLVAGFDRVKKSLKTILKAKVVVELDTLDSRLGRIEQKVKEIDVEPLNDSLEKDLLKIESEVQAYYTAKEANLPSSELCQKVLKELAALRDQLPQSSITTTLARLASLRQDLRAWQKKVAEKKPSGYDGLVFPQMVLDSFLVQSKSFGSKIDSLLKSCKTFYSHDGTGKSPIQYYIRGKMRLHLSEGAPEVQGITRRGTIKTGRRGRPTLRLDRRTKVLLFPLESLPGKIDPRSLVVVAKPWLNTDTFMFFTFLPSPVNNDRFELAEIVTEGTDGQLSDKVYRIEPKGRIGTPYLKVRWNHWKKSKRVQNYSLRRVRNKTSFQK